MRSDQLPAAQSRAQEVSEILASVQDLIFPYIQTADLAKTDCPDEETGVAIPFARPNLVDAQSPEVLLQLLPSELPHYGRGHDGLREAAQWALKHSVNTWDVGFLDKLYASTDAPGLAAELLLAALNTNLHVFKVSPSLSVIEKVTARALAQRFGFNGENAGGVTLPGGSASNLTSMLIARNNMFPSTKADGNASVGADLVVFTSAESHYSISTAAVQLGLGSKNVRAIPTLGGAMDAAALRKAVQASVSAGQRPFYVCATAGTTVNGAYDPLGAIAEVCKAFSLWLHIDACWGGSAIFSPTYQHLLAGSEQASSISFNPHKMLGVPVTCSFLLGADMRQFYFANSLEAGYLFHEAEPRAESNGTHADTNGDVDLLKNVPAWNEVFDLAKFTPQCGRKGDSLKMYLAWQFYGTAGLARNVEAAFTAARRLAAELAKDKHVLLLNGYTPSCCQVCFRYVGAELERSENPRAAKERNSKVTRGIVAALGRRGWLIDYTTSEEGEYMRVVCNRNTTDEVVASLAKAITASGEEVLHTI